MNITGNTPLVSIDEDERIWAKLETHNRTGSVKDRMIEYICDEALAIGLIDPEETTLVEATSGNTGIALASYAASIGCRCKIIMPQNMSEQRKDMMRAFGAEIIETGFNQFSEAIHIRNEMIFEKSEDSLKEFKKGFYSPLQFENKYNIMCHKSVTAPEIHGQIKDFNIGKWNAFIHGAGTGGTMMGMKQYFMENKLDVKCVLTQPAEDNSSHGIQGINDGGDFLLNRDLMDETISIKTEDAISRMKKFWKEKGILVGISSGANILAAEKYVEMYDPEGVVVTMLCDRGERYL
jgi:cysteine synthase A